MTEALVAFFEATVRTATPLALAALGEMIVERSGVINIGVEGTILVGALAGVAVAGSVGVELGLLGAALAGVLTAVILAFFIVVLRANQIVTGTAVTLLSLGVTGLVYRGIFGSAGAALSIPTAGPVAIPLLSSLPLLGRALFSQPVTTYAVYLLVPLITWWLYRTHAGLALRAVGENADAAAAAGISPSRVRWAALLFGGALGGLSGGSLAVAQVGTFAEGMSAGRGFIAIAIVALGRWSPVGVALAAVLFGAASALQFAAQSLGRAVPYHAFLALPYALTLLALAGAAGRIVPPAGLGRN
ncbi:MAG TPA: ABC transporter permease [Gemmatimonadaceae bacterium]|nr:ABC transporter permease [Gemmatimonadaceae bacterium]